MKKLIILTLALALLGTVLLAQKAEKPMNMSASDKPMMKAQSQAPGFWMDELKLTPAQKTKLEAQKVAFRKLLNTHEAEMENLKIDLMTALRSADFIKVKALNKAMADKQLDIANARADHFENMFKELTAEQKELMKNHLPMMFKGDGQRPGMGAPMMHQGGGKGMQGGCDDCGQHGKMPKGKMQHKK